MGRTFQPNISALPELTHEIAPPERDSKLKGAATKRPFITVDLENYQDEDGRAIPMLYGFRGETEELIVKGPNVSAEEMLQLTIDAGRRWPTAIFVGYAFTSYDANFFLRSMPLKIAEAIAKGKPRYHNGFRIHWLRGKFFRISQGKHETRGERHSAITVTIYETVSWFGGKKLTAAIQDHLGDVPDLIARGKDMRDTFEYSDLDDLVLPYWRIEQDYFRALMVRMRELIINAQLALPRDWWGPSCLTAAAFNAEGVKQHMRRDLPSEYMRACQRAYFGGRFEQPQGGFHDAPVWQYDIVSAYPSAQVGLWSWRDSDLIYIPGNRIDRSRAFSSSWTYSLWDVEFNFTGNAVAAEFATMPLPLRDHNGAVYFPTRVRGTYWSPEIRALWNSRHLEIRGAWIIKPGRERPFLWMADYYARRLELKDAGDPAQYPVKITLNSAYGKTAQRAGAKRDRDGKWRLPAFHQLDWAGFITSMCRARMLNVISRVGWDKVISIETDGIFLTVPCPELEVNPRKLGAWELSEHTGMITLQNGVYWTRGSDGNFTPGKVRGIRRGSPGVAAEDALDFLGRYSRSREAKPLYGDVRMFHGAGHALGRDKFLTWTSESKAIAFGGNGKRFHVWREDQQPHQHLIRLSNGDMLMAARGETAWNSYPHALPWESYGGRTTTFRDYLEDEVEMGQVIM